MNLKRLSASIFLAFSMTNLWQCPAFAMDNKASEERAHTLTQEEFETLKSEKSRELWNAEDYMTRYGYMMGIRSSFFQYRINAGWKEFYALHKDPSGKTWDLGEGQQYSLEGDII